MTNKKLFRSKALNQLSSPDNLDHLMRVVTPKRWIVWAACTLLTIMGAIWAVYGSIPTKVTGQGILIEHGALFDVVALGKGQIQEIHVDIGDEVSPGHVLATLAMPTLEHDINEAQRILENLLKEREKVSSFGERTTTLKQTNLDERRKAILESISLLEKQLQDILNRERNYEKLMKSGALSKKNYMDVKHKHYRILQEITNKRVELTRLPSEKVAVISTKEKELIHIEQRIIQAEEKLDTLVDRQELESKVISPHKGRVQEQLKRIGQMLRPGEPFLKIHMESKRHNATVLAYLSPLMGKQAQAGMTAFITPTTIKEEEFGHMLGKVEFISDFPASENGMLRELQNKKLVSSLSKQGPPLMLTVQLTPDKNTPSGFAWSSGQGPSMAIGNGTLCKVEVVVRRQSPASLVLPFLRRNVLGVGDKR